jgi:transposase
MIAQGKEKEQPMAYRYGDDRNQMILFPQSIDQYVSPEHPVRAYDAFVDSLDLTQLGIDFDDRKVGNSQYDPRLMLKLLLYGYSYGVKSSRKLERELHNNLSFIWLMKNLKPDHKTIAEFRRKNKQALKNALKLCARLCLKLGLIQGNILFVDSTKVRANAGRAHQHGKKWYRKQLKKVDQRIEQLLAECERVDQREAGRSSMVKMPEELKNQQQLKASIESALAELAGQSERTKDGKDRKVNRVDPQSRQMKSRQGTHPSYAVQSVVDDQNGLIVQIDAVNDANDTSQLADQIKAAEENLNHDCQIACADAGYSNIDQIEKIESEQRSVLVPSQRQTSDKSPGPFDKSRFVYDPKQDCYLCPQGYRLIFRRFQDKAHKKRDYRIEQPALCRACGHFGVCTKSKSGRTITRHVSEALKQKVEQRYEHSHMRQIYDRRKARVEHPFGYIKKVLNFTQFSLRGRAGAQTEASILATCFNLTRMIALMGGVHQMVTTLATV